MTALTTRLDHAVGAPTAEVLEAAFGMRTVGDLLRHYPRRYIRQGDLSDLSDMRPGDYVTVVAEVKAAENRTSARGAALTQVVITDGRGELDLTFFGQAWRRKQLSPGTRALFAGELSTFRGRRQLAHPLVELRMDSQALLDLPMLPIYPATGKISSWKIAVSVSTVLALLDELPDPLPAQLRAEHRLADFDTAIRAIHRPETPQQAEAARGRLKWDEAFTLQVALARRRAAALSLPAVPRPPRDGGLRAAFDAALPFALTAGQQEVDRQLAADLAGGAPMHRLLAGEVGSGKTLVALRAMLTVIDNGGQAALLAPTEVLAAQHERSLRQLLGPLGCAGELGSAPEATRVALLTGSQPAAARRAALAAAADGSAGIVVGTHALLSEGVGFADLGLVVVDEQHRFGVEQRAALRARGRQGSSPHVLVMTATPIPRTVAMTVFGDLETSVLTELPRGRQPIATHVVPDARATWTARMWDRVREEVAAGRQAFVVCPRIDAADGEEDGPDLDGPPESAGRPAAAVQTVAPLLAAGELAGIEVGVLHGRLPADRKAAVMDGFVAGRLPVLVATTVVEVGVDVPNATVMVVLDADRFGVSQLHQLRGRIGRGSQPGTCFLHTAVPDGSPAGQRLAAVAGTTDGARLAELDLLQRGEGDVLGARQSGLRSRLALLRIIEDEPIVAAAREHAQQLVAADPELAGQPALAAAVEALVEDAAFLEKG